MSVQGVCMHVSVSSSISLVADLSLQPCREKENDMQDLFRFVLTLGGLVAAISLVVGVPYFVYSLVCLIRRSAKRRLVQELIDCAGYRVRDACVLIWDRLYDGTDREIPLEGGCTAYLQHTDVSSSISCLDRNQEFRFAAERRNDVQSPSWGLMDSNYFDIELVKQLLHHVHDTI